MTDKTHARRVTEGMDGDPVRHRRDHLAETAVAAASSDWSLLVAAGRAGQLARVDEVLAPPDTDRLVADAEELGDLGGLPSGCDEIANPAAELVRTVAGHHGLRRLLERQLSSNPTPPEPGHITSPKLDRFSRSSTGTRHRKVFAESRRDNCGD
ncbi:hypothetical protein [Streptomyces sp. NPDC059378]|uniref:hypothetical protein n=1 Tax=Streptomyces sp. NPDC059378 TaxID=3346815 RepID=UPI00369164B5